MIYWMIYLTPNRDRTEPRGSVPPTPPAIRLTYQGGSAG